MVGIYKYECGRKFTGIIANSYEEAEKYLGNKYGYMGEVFAGRDENGQAIWETKFVPYYNKNAFAIEELTIV